MIFLEKLDFLLFCQHTKPGLSFGLEEVCLREAIGVDHALSQLKP